MCVFVTINSNHITIYISLKNLYILKEKSTKMKDNVAAAGYSKSTVANLEGNHSLAGFRL
jgi:hypothetical protein